MLYKFRLGESVGGGGFGTREELMRPEEFGWEKELEESQLPLLWLLTLEFALLTVMASSLPW
jgi:hypothetical protein